MNSLVKSLILPLLESNRSGVALVPGGFKPPTVGHFHLASEVAKRPEIDKVIILIGHKTRDGVTKEESKAIWDIYKKYLPSNVEIKIADNSSPISDVGSLIKNNPDTFFFPVVGIRGEFDLGDLKRFDSMKGKYENFQTIVIKTDEGKDRVSGTNTRNALIGGNKEKFQTYLPTELSDEDKEKVWNILQKTPLNENYAEPSKFDYPKQLKALTEFMLDKGMNIRPLPKVKFVEDDVENAKNFLGKTAYYDPYKRVIVLYTMDRHPKDVMRSFAHEMIHHMQNCDNRLGNIVTQDTNEDGDLPEIEKEAYEKGNMTFRNWTDTLTEGIFGDRIVCDNCGWSWPIKDGGDDLYICHDCGYDNTPIPLNEDILNEGKYDKLTNSISSAIFNHWKQDYENEVDESHYDQTYEMDDLYIEVNADIKFIPGSKQLKVDGGADPKTEYLEIKFEIDPDLLPDFWEEVSMNLKDVVRHEIEHLTHGEGPNLKPSKYIPDDQLIRAMIDAKMLPQASYFKLEKEIDANLQGMYLRAKKEKRPFKDVLDTYLDSQAITPKEKKEILNIWRKRSKALSLPKF
jgi:phosphopantetheine adenylyltransferase